MDNLQLKVEAVLVLIALSVAAIFAIPTVWARSSPSRPALASHNPILIEGNAEFTFANGVTSGSGTVADPYVISDWDIDAFSATAITIRNTTAYFAIRSVFIHNTQLWSHGGIDLTNVQHARTENTTIEYASVGLSGQSLTDIRIANCTFHFNDQAIALSLTSQAKLESNTVDSNGAQVGFTVQTGQDIVFGNNTLTRTVWAIQLQDTSSVLIQGNVFRDNPGTSIGLSGSSRVRIENNTLVNDASGIDLDDTRDTSISGNQVYDSPTALSARRSSNLAIDRNNFTGVGVGIAFDTVSTVTLSNNSVNTYRGVALSAKGSSSLTLGRNSFDAGGLMLEGTVMAHFDSHTIPTDNVVNGLPLRYLKDCNGETVDGAVTGQIVVANCTGVTLANLTIAQAGVAAWFGFADSVVIANSTFTANAIAGVEFSDSTRFVLRGNNLSGNQVGVEVVASTDGHLSGNSFSSNAQSAHVGAGSARLVWDDGYPSGGNAWSDYRGWDDCGGPDQNVCPGSDGLGDIPYVIDGANSDRYPLLPANPVNQPPVVVLEVSTRLPAYTTDRVGFVAERSYDPDGWPLTHRWSWGDGASLTTLSSNVVHVYTEPGSYPVSLTVEDVRHATATTSLDILVVAVPLLPLVPYTNMGFQLRVPQNWTVRENVGPGAALRVYGPPLIDPAAIAVDTKLDFSIEESHSTLSSFVEDALRKIEGANPPGYLDGQPDFRRIANHAAVSFVITYPYNNLVVRSVYVASESNGRWWRITLTSQITNFAVVEGNFVVLNATFERILASFEITAATIPRLSILSSEVLVPVGAVGGTAGFAGILSLWVLHPRRQKNSSVRPPP